MLCPPPHLVLRHIGLGMDLHDEGTLRLFVNGQPAGEGQIKRVGIRSGGLEPFEVGRDSITPVTRAYADKGTFPFNGTIERITFQLAPAAGEKK